MNYIYDIYINLNELLYDFYEWNKSDNIIHIKKIPFFIIDSNTFKYIISNKIKIDSNFLKKINNKTEIWSPIISIPYCALFCDYNDIIVVQFDKYGYSIKKSFLNIDEENEIIEDIEKNSISNITFKLVGKTNSLLKTRKQIKIDRFINKELKNIDNKRLNYICYECLGYISNNINDLKKLDHSSKKYKNLYDILKLTSKASK